MPTTEAQRRAVEKYDAQNTRQIKMKLNLTTDADILDWLDAQENKQGAIKEAIRARISDEKTPEN